MWIANYSKCFDSIEGTLTASCVKRAEAHFHYSHVQYLLVNHHQSKSSEIYTAKNPELLLSADIFLTC
jgi:beta-galactosidase beta subunit